jgi:hypothetical protein
MTPLVVVEEPHLRAALAANNLAFDHFAASVDDQPSSHGYTQQSQAN